MIFLYSMARQELNSRAKVTYGGAKQHPFVTWDFGGLKAYIASLPTKSAGSEAIQSTTLKASDCHLGKIEITCLPTKTAHPARGLHMEAASPSVAVKDFQEQFVFEA